VTLKAIVHECAGGGYWAEVPAIPLYPNPSWAEFNTSRFKGFPTAAAPYADPSPNKFDRGETLQVLTALEPRGR
jgi:peptide/nickel transport system substrate-binding protein